MAGCEKMFLFGSQSSRKNPRPDRGNVTAATLSGMLGMEVTRHAPNTTGAGFVMTQPRSDVMTLWTTPALRAFGSLENRNHLKQEILRRFNGAISDAPLIVMMDRYGAAWYQVQGTEYTYQAQTWPEIQEAVANMNARVLFQIGREYQSQRAAETKYLIDAHQSSTRDAPPLPTLQSYWVCFNSYAVVFVFFSPLPQDRSIETNYN